MKSVLLLFVQCLAISGVAQTHQELLRSQLQKAPDKVFHSTENEMQTRESRAVIFYDDFSNPANWTMTNTSTPSSDWIISDTIAISQITAYFNSTSGGNFALADSWSQGSFQNQNMNITTSNTYDCSSLSNVQLGFENFHIKNNNGFYLMVSNDGVNFDTYEQNENYSAFNSYSENTEKVIVNISSSAAFQSTVWIRFNVQANSYGFWAIDDVSLENGSFFDLAGSNLLYCDVDRTTIFGERIEHTILPFSQLRSIHGFANTHSTGWSVISDGRLKMSLVNSAAQVILSDSTADFPVSPNFHFDSIPIATSSLMSDNYKVRLAITSDSNHLDSNQNNNVAELDYTIDQMNVFARDNNTFSRNGIWNGEGNAYIIGNEFKFTGSECFSGIDVAFATGTDAGAVICPIIYEMDPNAATVSDVFIPVYDYCLEGIEYTIQASDISSGSSIVWTTLWSAPFANWFIFDAGKSYVVGMNHYGGTKDVILMYGGETVLGAATSWIYDPTATTGGPWFYMTSKPMIRLARFCDGSVSDQIRNNLNMGVSPNPSTEFVRIDYTLRSDSEVHLLINDVSGKEVKTQHLGTQLFGENSVELNVADLSQGIYFCTLKAGESEHTVKLQVVR